MLTSHSAAPAPLSDDIELLKYHFSCIFHQSVIIWFYEEQETLHVHAVLITDH